MRRMEMDRATLDELIKLSRQKQIDSFAALQQAPAATVEEETLEVEVDGWEATVAWLKALRAQVAEPMVDPIPWEPPADAPGRQLGDI